MARPMMTSRTFSTVWIERFGWVQEGGEGRFFSFLLSLSLSLLVACFVDSSLFFPR